MTTILSQGKVDSQCQPFITNSSFPVVHEVDSIAGADVAEGNDDAFAMTILSLMRCQLQLGQHVDDEGARPSLYDTTADEMTESEESDDDFDNKDLPWD